MLTSSQETSDSVTPSSKRVYATKLTDSEQSSSSKKFCVQPLDLEKSEPEFNDELGIKEVKNVKITNIVEGAGITDKGKSVKCHETPQVVVKKAPNKVVTACEDQEGKEVTCFQVVLIHDSCFCWF